MTSEVTEKNRLVAEVAGLYTVILVVWGFYRLLFRLPVWIEELVIKPMVFVAPVIYRLYQEKSQSWSERWASLGVTRVNLGMGLGLGLALGAFYLLVGGAGASKEMQLGSVGLTMVLAVATAISEQLVFMGYILLRLARVWRQEWGAVVVTAVLLAVIHVPILVFDYRLPGREILGQFLLVLALGLGNGAIMLRVKNLITPVLAHSLWGWAMVIFG